MTELNMKTSIFFLVVFFFWKGEGGGGGVVGVENFFNLELTFQPKTVQNYEKKSGPPKISKSRNKQNVLLAV